MEKKASCQQVVLEQLDSHVQSNGPQTLLITRRTISNGPQTLLITRRTIDPKEEIRDCGFDNALLNSSQIA